VAENNKSTSPVINAKELSDINSKFHEYFDDVSLGTIGQNPRNARDIDRMAKDLDKVLSDEYSSMSAYSGKDFSQFINQALQEPGGNSTTLDKVIDNDANSFNTFFYERYKNINNKYEDLRMITENLCEMSTAVTTLRDNITASDGVMSGISKTIDIKGCSEDVEKRLRDIIEEIEDKYNLESKLHDTIIPNTLTYGDFLVMKQPYSRIFSKFALDKKSGRPSFLTEALVYDANATSNKKDTTEYNRGLNEDANAVFEAFAPEVNKLKGENASLKSSWTKKGVADFLNEVYSHLEVINDGDAPLMEDADIASLSDPNLLKMIAKKKREKGPAPYDPSSIGSPNDGVYMADLKQDNAVLPEYRDVTGVYMKLLSPLRTVPVYVLDECIGYYILYETYGEIRNNMLQNNQLNRTNLVFQQVRNKDCQQSIVDVIANRIIKKIDNKMVKNNPQFRELMVNALMYEDLYRKDFKVQFVSAEYITHFKVNEDIDTHLGTSMLKRSLFYAKLYMTYLMFLVISTVTRTNDTRVFYIKQSGIDRNVQKQVQKAARDYKDNQISYNDIASVNTLMSKAGKAKDLFVATGSSGERPVDIDIISGQDVNINNDFVEFLRKNAINGTDVPSVILEYNDSADFARSIEMGNIKYANKICSTQKELNGPCTELYRSMIRFEHPEISEEDIDRVYFRFNRPKSLSVQNDADMYNNAEQAATFLVKTVMGDNTEKYDDAAKDKLFKHIITTCVLPGMYDWEGLTKEAEDIIRSYGAEKQESKLITKPDEV